MMMIAHLSDLHVGEGSLTERMKEVRLLFTKIADDQSVDVVAITGDLTDHGKSHEFDALTGPMRDLCSKKKVFLTVGNHDAGWHGILYQRKAHERALDFVSDMTGVASFPHHEVIGQTQFIVLDSIQGVSERRFRPWNLARGELGSSQIDGIELRDDLRNIILLHHHPYFRKVGLDLKDSEDFVRALESDTYVLYGHKHVASHKGSFYASDKSVDSLGYRVIDTSNNTWEWRLI